MAHYNSYYNFELFIVWITSEILQLIHGLMDIYFVKYIFAFIIIQIKMLLHYGRFILLSGWITIYYVAIHSSF